MEEQEIAEQCEINVYSYLSVYFFVNNTLQNRDKETSQGSLTSLSILPPCRITERNPNCYSY